MPVSNATNSSQPAEMKDYTTAAIDHEGFEITSRRGHDTSKDARAWMKEARKDARFWDQLAERDGFHKEVACIALFADGEEIDRIDSKF